MDTGSVCSFINQEAADELVATGGKLHHENWVVSLADGSEIKLNYSIHGSVTAHDDRVELSFLVMPNLSHPILLGMDFINKSNTKIKVNNHDLLRNKNSAVIEVCAMDSPGLKSMEVDQEETLVKFIEQQMALFSEVTGCTPLLRHEIILEDKTPLKQRYQQRNPAVQKRIIEEVRKMLKEKVIEPSKSAWSSPIVLVKKKDGSWRFCVDFRRLNKATKKDAYPLPRISSILDQLKGAKYLSTIDLKNGYWQVALTENSKHLTAFTVPGMGLFEFKVMPFGLHSAPATFQRLIDLVIPPELAPKVFAYLDDIVVTSSTFEEHLRLLEEIFIRLRKAKLKPNLEKCVFARTQLRYLGHVIDEKGLHPDPEKISAISNLKAPTCLKEIRQFLGMVSWYRRFIKDISTVIAPLTRLLKKGVDWNWGPTQTEAFLKLKHLLTEAPVLACPDWDKTFYLQTDASLEGLGVVLTQGEESTAVIIAYASRALNPAEKNYSATELECLAVKWGIWKMRHYLEGYHFVVVTDHQSLKWLNNIETPSGRLARWIMELAQWDFEVKYKKGIENRLPDYLSRSPITIMAINNDAPKTWYYRILKAVEDNPEGHPDYRLEDGKLYHHVLHSLDFNDMAYDEQWKLCVPKEERRSTLKKIHDEPTAGHLGVAKTISRLAQYYYWPGMLRDGADYVRSCESCQHNKSSQQASSNRMHASLTEAPWQTISIDFIGPLPRTKTGHTMLCVMQDRFTKWIELKSLHKATSQTVVKAIKELIIYRQGCPKTVITDNGRQFISKEFNEFIEDYGITHRKTPPYSPQCNPVERVNKVIKTMIRQYLDRKKPDWDRHLQEIQFAYNTARHSSTGYSPAYLNSGREFLPPGFPDIRLNTTPSASDSRLKRIHDALELTRINLARSFQTQAKQYNLRKRPWVPKRGDQVMKRNFNLSNKAKKLTHKLMEKFSGPYTVKEMVSPVIYDLKDGKGKIHKYIHLKDLKPYVTRKEELRSK